MCIIEMWMNISGDYRSCECCGSGDLEVLWENKFNILKTKTWFWDMPATNVICRQCGFVFVSPAASQELLNQYYKDSYAYFSNARMDYYPEIRKEVLFQSMNNAGIRPSEKSVFVEVGCNIHTTFHEEISEIFDKVITVEVNSDVDSDYKSILDLENESADVLAHYYVLEHVPHVRNFLKKCYQVLKPGGLMIVEVPNLYLYDAYPGCLELAEHVNHFTCNNLDKICQSMGFNVIRSSFGCSRPFGFSAVYMKSSTDNVEGKVDNRDFNLYQQNKEAVLKTIAVIDKFNKQFRDIHDTVVEYCRGGKKVTLWVANNSLLYFMQKRELPATAVIVDSNPDKVDYLGQNTVFLPDMVANHIKESNLLVIFSAPNKDAILESIKVNYQKVFSDDEVVTVFDTGPMI